MRLTPYKLGDICRMKYGKMPPIKVVADEGYPIFSGYRITGYAKEYLYDEPRVIVVARGVGGTGDVKMSPEKSWITNLSIVLDHDERIVDKKFLLYRLGREPLKEKLNTGAAQAQITINSLSAYSITLPTLGAQKRITSILSAYDDLIENNRRRIQLLEQAARLLYKEWFVHLRFPGHEHTRIINGVPEGWEKKQVKDLLARIKRPGKVQKTDYLPDGPIPCIDQSREFIGGYTNKIETIIDELPMIVFGDHTRILKFIDFPFACGADGTQLLAAKDPKISQEFFFFALDAIDLSNYFYARHFKFLKDQFIFRPADILIERYTKVVRPIMKQIKVLREQNGQLAKARDLLLPKLMNGEIAV